MPRGVPARVRVIKNVGAESQSMPAEERSMNSLRKNSGLATHEPEPQECEINYSNEVKKEQVAKLDELVKEEFKTGKWVTVAGEP